VTAVVRRFIGLRDSVATGPHAATLVNWMNAHPLRVLAHLPDAEWTRVLATTHWLASERGHGRYLRQVPVPGVDTKFIETHRAVLADLLDVIRGDLAHGPTIQPRRLPAAKRLLRNNHGDHDRIG